MESSGSKTKISSSVLPLLDNLVTGIVTCSTDPVEIINADAALVVFTHLADKAPQMTESIASDLGITLTHSTDNDAAAFVNYVANNSSTTFLDKYVAYSMTEPDEADSFIKEVIQDGAIINASWLNFHRDARTLIADVMMFTEDREGLSTFFGDWLPGYEGGWLQNYTSLEERLHVVMQNDMTKFMDDYLDAVGIVAVNTSLESISQMSVGNYVQHVWEGVLHGSLNPTYTPPNVNTPDSSNIANDTIYLAEHHLYGSSRLGIKTYAPTEYRVIYKGATGPGTQNIILENTLGTLVPWYDGGMADWIRKDKATVYTGNTFNLATDSFREVRTLGAKQYELSDHLGNVLATVLDKKTGYGSTSGLYNGYYANLASVTDYYPGGFEMPGRVKTYFHYRFGNQKQESDDEIYGAGNVSSFKYRFEDTRLNRFFSVDPLSAKYPWNSSYAFSENRLTDGVELEGLEWAPYQTWKFWTSVGNTFVEDVKSLGKASTWYHMGDMFMIDDGSDPQQSQEMIERTQATVNYVKSVPSWGPTEWGNLGGHVLFMVVTDKAVKGLGEGLEVVKAKYMSGRFIIGNRTLMTVSKHLEQFGFKAENSVMLERMKQIANKQLKATEIDLNFAKHELRESELQAEYMKQGMSQADAQEAAHTATLQEQGMYHRNYEQKLYTPEAIEAGNKQLYDEQN